MYGICQFNGHLAAGLLRYDEGNGVVGVEIGVTAADADVGVLAESGSGVVYVCQEDGVDYSVFVAETDCVGTGVVQPELHPVLRVALRRRSPLL